MTKDYDYAFYLGRFQPFHKGHEETARYALKIAEKVIFIIGSSQASETYKNPFNVSQRKSMITLSLIDEISRFDFEYSYDNSSDDLWLKEISEITRKYRGKICFVANNKDKATGQYLDLLQTICTVLVDLPGSTGYQHIHASSIRGLMFDPIYGKFFSLSKAESFLPAAGYQYIASLPDEIIKRITDSIYSIANYKKSYESAPYPPILVTVDCVISKYITRVGQNGYEPNESQEIVYLFIERNTPGYGFKKLALVGGFVDASDPSLEFAIRREIEEEIGDYLFPNKKIPEDLFIATTPIDYRYSTNRSERGTSVTFIFILDLSSKRNRNLSKEKFDCVDATFTNEEVGKVVWLSMDEIKRTPREKFFEDHFEIVTRYG